MRTKMFIGRVSGQILWCIENWPGAYSRAKTQDTGWFTIEAKLIEVIR